MTGRPRWQTTAEFGTGKVGTPAGLLLEILKSGSGGLLRQTSAPESPSPPFYQHSK